jgi:hypothetical protein
VLATAVTAADEGASSKGFVPSIELLGSIVAADEIVLVLRLGLAAADATSFFDALLLLLLLLLLLVDGACAGGRPIDGDAAVKEVEVDDELPRGGVVSLTP